MNDCYKSMAFVIWLAFKVHKGHIVLGLTCSIVMCVAKADWVDSRTFSTKICARVDRTHPDLSVSIGRENEGKTSDWSAAT